MSDTVTFDTHAFVKRFRSVGFTEEQAETQVKAISEAMEAKDLATKRDLQEGLTNLELRLVKWMVGTSLASVGITITCFFVIIRMLGPR